MNRRQLPPTLGHNSDLDVVGQADDPFHQTAAKNRRPPFMSRPGNEDLCDFVATGEVDQSLGHIFALQDAGLDMQVAGEIHMLFHSLALAYRNMVQATVAEDTDREALRLEVIGHAPAAPDQRR
jgi:hypothetical protein